MSYTHEEKSGMKKCSNILLQSNDPRFNYLFIKEKEQIENYHETPELITLNQYDYSFKKDDGDENTLPKLCPASLYQSQAGGLEAVEEWYRRKFPNLPDDYHGIMARYSTGTLMTKKETKNAVKKAKRKPDKKVPVGLQMLKGKFNVVFD